MTWDNKVNVCVCTLYMSNYAILVNQEFIPLNPRTSKIRTSGPERGLGLVVKRKDWSLDSSTQTKGWASIPTLLGVDRRNVGLSGCQSCWKSCAPGSVRNPVSEEQGLSSCVCSKRLNAGFPHASQVLSWTILPALLAVCQLWCRVSFQNCIRSKPQMFYRDTP